MDIIIYIDADACPVKDEIYKVALRHQLQVYVVSNSFILTPQSPMINKVIVEKGADVADSIGMALAQRSLMEQLREAGEITGGPSFFSPSHRSKFLKVLNEAIVREKRRQSRSIDR